MPGPNTPYTQLDFAQVLKQAFDESTDRLRVDATVTAEIGDVVLDADTSDIAIQDRVSGYQLAINADGTIDVNVVLSASTDSIRLGDGTNNTTVTAAGALKVDSSHVTQPVSNTELTAYVNTRTKIVNAEDVTATYAFADFGTANERVTSIVYTSPTYSGTTVTKTLNYTLDGSSYRLTTVVWTVV